MHCKVMLTLTNMLSISHCTECGAAGQGFNTASNLRYVLYIIFNIYGSVHHKNILMNVQKDATLHSLFYLETALHVSGGTTTHHQECKQLYLQHLVFVTMPRLWKSWNWFDCAVAAV
jgi:hypothetical protein